MNPTKDELLEQARDLDIEGRSDMSKDELEEAVADAQASQPDPDAPDESTSPKTAPVPTAADQPGIGGGVDVQSDPRRGQPSNRSASRLGVTGQGTKVEERRKLAQEHRAAAVNGD